MKNNPKKRHSEDEINILLLFIGLIIMIICFALIPLFFNYVLGITYDVLVSGYWIFAVIPVLYYYYFLQKRNRIHLSELGLYRKGVFKGIFLGITGGIATGLFG